MPLLVTSASGVNGDGYGALLAFDRNGARLGVFCNDKRIADPRGLVVHQHEGLLYLNSGQDRVLALDAAGTVVRDTGPIKSLNPGGEFRSGWPILRRLTQRTHSHGISAHP